MNLFIRCVERLALCLELLTMVLDIISTVLRIAGGITLKFYGSPDEPAEAYGRLAKYKKFLKAFKQAMKADLDESELGKLFEKEKG